MTFISVISTAFITVKYYRTRNNCVGSRYESLRAGRFGVRTTVGVKFHGPVQTSPGAHPATCTTRNRVPFTGVKRPGRDADHPPPYRAEIKETVELHISPAVPSWHVI